MSSSYMVLMNATITAVHDWNAWCWDVLLDFGDSAMAVQFPREHQPVAGDNADLLCTGVVRWRGLEIVVDHRPMKVGDDGKPYLG
jgi:hypothetical protein